MRRAKYISGPSLLGFWGAFDGDAGNPDTPRPYPVVTPSTVGGVILPFRCPHCAVIPVALADSVRRGHYYDKNRRFWWCPSCHKRLVINLKGAPLAESLPAGANCAPSSVDWGEGKAPAAALIAEADHLLALPAKETTS